ncbi:MAG: metallophosphoesterase [Candidatus Riflebacteria bacterium]|nr:metallophosphoesterase [Candidatus Riflebacteria bacterium]
MLGTLGAVAAGCLLADALLMGPFDMQRRRIRLALPRVPETLRGKRILQLSDLHVTGWTYREVFLRQQVQESRPDLLVLTGDLISATAGIPIVLELLQGLTAPLGIWFVPGNNEIEEADVHGFQAQLESLSLRPLVNRAVQLGPDCWLAGVNDPSMNKDDLGRALRDVPAGAFRILLAHSPEVFYQAADRGVELTLAGHTHGGQVRFPFLGALYADTQRSGLAFVDGEYRRGPSVLHVSRGVGTSVLPIRFLCPPEILEFELVEG